MDQTYGFQARIYLSSKFASKVKKQKGKKEKKMKKTLQPKS